MPFICSEFENEAVAIDARQFKMIILAALKQVHGDQGAAISGDVLKFDKGRAFIRFPAKYVG